MDLDFYLRRILRLADEPAGGIAGLGLDVRIAGELTPLEKVALKSPDMFARLQSLSETLTEFTRSGLDAHRHMAIAEIDALFESLRKHLKGKDWQLAVRKLYGYRLFLEQGADAMLEVTERQAKRLAKYQAIAQNAAKKGKAEAKELREIESALRRSLTDVASGRRLRELADGGATPEVLEYALMERKALAIFAETYPLVDDALISVVSKKLLSYKKLKRVKAKKIDAFGGPDALFGNPFYKLLRPEASGLKGWLLEQWFWHSEIWAKWSGPLISQAEETALLLKSGPNVESFVKDLEVQTIRKPLFELRNGQEIYDGIVAPLAQVGEKKFIGYIEAVIQIKAERNISVTRQIAKDQRREIRDRAKFQLRDKDRNLYVFMPKPNFLDSPEPLRLIVAPELPSAANFAAFKRLPDLYSSPIILNSDQLDAIAYMLLRARALQLAGKI